MKPLSENRRARFDYDILETFEAGIELEGHEVKSAKAGHMNLSGSYAIIRGGEAYLINSDIPPYQAKNSPPDYDHARTRKLLLSKKEISSLDGRLREKGLSLIALDAHLTRNYIKVSLGLGRARKKGDKREVLKKKTHLREMERERD